LRRRAKSSYQKTLILPIQCTEKSSDFHSQNSAPSCTNISSGFTLVDLRTLGIVPDVHPQRVAMLFNPDTAPGGGKYYFSEFEAAARSSNVEPIAARAHSDAEIENVVNSLGGESGSGLIVMPDYFMVIHVKPILLLAARNKVPAIYPWRFVVARDSALLSYGPDLKDIVRRGAAYVDRVLRGAKPADLPVQVPVKFEMAVNESLSSDVMSVLGT
jgi:putative tryptophan/tyrosine transport system substrate-binding protein